MALPVASPINMYDAAILVAYFILFVTKRDFRVLLCIIPMLIYVATYEGGDTFAYILYCGLYIALSYYFIKTEGFKFRIPFITMAIYDLIYSLDSYMFGVQGLIEPNADTWLYKNHALIVCFLHAFIMLVFSKKFTSLVDACFSYVHMLWNDCTSNSARTSNAKRQPSEARNK